MSGGPLLMACGDDDDDGNGGQPTSAPSRTAIAVTPTEDGSDASPTAPPGPPTSECCVTIVAQDFSFSPDGFEAVAGAPITVTLQNEGNSPHTLTVYADEDFSEPVADADTGQVSSGASGGFTVTFDLAGAAYFRCEVHPDQMQGEITISDEL